MTGKLFKGRGALWLAMKAGLGTSSAPQTFWLLRVLSLIFVRILPPAFLSTLASNDVTLEMD